jgi:hypothetical protein
MPGIMGNNRYAGALVLRLDPGPDYQLRWPRDLLVAELEAARSLGPDAVELVLGEAFIGDEPVDDFRRAGFGDFPNSEVVRREFTTRNTAGTRCHDAMRASGQLLTRPACGR